MLSKFTWSDYLIAAAIFIAIYYLVVAVTFYRTEIKNLLSGKVKFKLKSKNISEDYKGPGEMEEADFDELETVVAELKSGILERAGKEATKAELISQLQRQLANYGGLHRPAYRVAINHYIIGHAKELCGVMFREEELDEAWKNMPH